MQSTPKPEWDPRAEAVQADQIKAYDAMRQRCPVAHSEYQHWSVFRHAETLAILEDHDTFSNRVSQHLSVPNGMDPPEHGRYRALIEPYFNAAALAEFAPKCQAIARQLVAALPMQAEVEIVSRLSRPFAVQIQCAFMGWPESLHEPLSRWVRDNHEATLAGDREAMAKVAADFDALITARLAERRQAGAAAPDDVTTRLMAERIDGEPLGDDVLVSILRNWTVGELATISASVSIVIHYLAHHPALLARLKAGDEPLEAALDEILRIDAPLISNRRVTTRAVDIGGQTLPPGERLTLLWASANRDERVFGNPDAYRPAENARHNLLYGAGIHICPGAPLARMELRHLFEAFLDRFSAVYLDETVRPERARFPTGGFDRLQVSLSSAPKV